MSLFRPISNAEFFSRDYFNRGMKECPKVCKILNCFFFEKFFKLVSLLGESINDYMTAVVACNLAYNAFYRGERSISTKLLKSVLASSNLPGT